MIMSSDGLHGKTETGRSATYRDINIYRATSETEKVPPIMFDGQVISVQCSTTNM